MILIEIHLEIINQDLQVIFTFIFLDQKVSKFRSLVGAKKIEGDNDDPNYDEDEAPITI